MKNELGVACWSVTRERLLLVVRDESTTVRTRAMGDTQHLDQRTPCLISGNGTWEDGRTTSLKVQVMEDFNGRRAILYCDVSNFAIASARVLRRNVADTMLSTT